MEKLFVKILKQSLIIMAIALVFVICSSIFGSIHLISEGIEESIAITKDQVSQINTDGEVDDVEGYGNIVNGLVGTFTFFTAGLLWIIKILMQVFPILAFVVVAFSVLIAWLFNLGKEAKWKRNTGIVFWFLNLVKLVLIIAICISFIISVEFALPYTSYFGCIVLISVASIIWQIVLMVKNKECFKIAKK